MGVVGALCLLSIMSMIWLLPRWVEAFLRWVDLRIPGDFSDLHRPAAGFIVVVLSTVVLVVGGLTIVAIAGANLDGVLHALQVFGLDIGRWARQHLIRIGVILFLAYFGGTRVISRALPPLVRRTMARRAEDAALPSEVEKREKTLSNVIVGSINIFIWATVFFIILSDLGISIAPLLAGAGVLGIAISFAAQNTIRDILNGLAILLEDQYRVGDVVTLAGQSGLVEDFNLRRTVLRDLGYRVHVIPNGEIRIATNFTKEKSRVNLNIEVAYKEDLDHCIDVLNRVGKEMKQDPSWSHLMNEPIQVLRVDNFGESGIAIKVLGETKPLQQWAIAGEYRRRVKKAFDQEGIEIPFPHRTLYWGKGAEPSAYLQGWEKAPQVASQFRGGVMPESKAAAARPTGEDVAEDDG
ncbi:MAG: mechanosensitive ion channel family protein [Chloroflexi bacterium]|nr:mechanosensitive ion channel family protein [Chloroflexota bacterium]